VLQGGLGRGVVLLGPDRCRWGDDRYDCYPTVCHDSCHTPEMSPCVDSGHGELIRSP
jgi:hypothetical protein